MNEGASILVTGGAGYIGSHAVLALREQGERPIVLDDLSTGVRAAVPADVPFVLGDVADRRLVAELICMYRVEAVMHFAGSAIVPESVSDPLSYYENNMSASCVLIQACVKHGIRHFIFASSAAVYGCPTEIPISEDTAPRPINPYGASKWMVERVLQDAAAAHPFRYVTLRYFNVAGADPQGRVGESTRFATHLVKVASQAAVGKRPYIEIYGDDYDTPDGTCIRDYIHVMDLVAVHLEALRHLRAGGENVTFNCGYGHGYSVREIVAAVERVAKVRLDIRIGPRRPGDPPVLIADPARIRERCGWCPRYADLNVIVETALNWERRLVAKRVASPEAAS